MYEKPGNSLHSVPTENIALGLMESEVKPDVQEYEGYPDPQRVRLFQISPSERAEKEPQ